MSQRPISDGTDAISALLAYGERMESDIVERLREATVPRLEMGWPAPHVVQRKEPLWMDAADEIERLRERLVCAAATATSEHTTRNTNEGAEP
jgi:hypothetical protein